MQLKTIQTIQVVLYLAGAAFAVWVGYLMFSPGYPIAGALIALWVVTIPAQRWLAARDRQLAAAYAPDVFALSPTEYEQHCAARLYQAGWQVIHIGGTGDQGVDLLASHRGISVAIQCKRYRGIVGNGAVQEVAAGRIHHGAHFAVVVAPSGYTAHAADLAASTGVLLLHHDDLGLLAHRLNS